jgi:cell division protein FtsQ
MSRVNRRAIPPAPPRIQDRPGRWKLLWRNQRRRLRTAALLGGLAVFVFGGLYTVQALGDGANVRERVGDVTATLGLRVTNVVIEGRTKTPQVMLNAALGIRPGEPILSYSLSEARQRLESIKWVEHATVERRLPGTILVRLTERRPFAVWQSEGKFLLVDREGEVVADSDVAAFADQLPLVVGPGAPKHAAALMELLGAQPELMKRVVAAVRVAERRWNLRMTNGADVMLPEGAEAQALARLAELHTSQSLLDRPLAVVDLRLPDRLVVRPHPDPKPQAQGRRT